MSIFDGATNQLVATVPVGREARGVAVNPVTNQIFVTAGKDDKVVVFDGTDNSGNHDHFRGRRC